uniref:TIGR00375 family protein n=1 Tax=Bacillus pumilus TaxID=1408 RepID=Q93PN4_BACPU|nr:unknown [Bacillus pumilus]
MQTYFADLHIHIGRTKSNRPVKITASNALTLERILYESSEEKGMDIIGVIDCHVPEVIETLADLLLEGICIERKGGGIAFQQTTLILGSEIEIYDTHCTGPIHVLIYIPTLKLMKEFSDWLSVRMKNNTLSSQRIYESGLNVQKKVKQLGGLFIPAHIFTPYKSLYGRGVNKSLLEVFDPNLIDAVELGLSADTEMADQLKELQPYSFLTNSDAHSLAKIGREYQKLLLKEASFHELSLALQQKEGRRIITNYGLNPKLGKYHQSVCEECMVPIDIHTFTQCTHCGHHRYIKGVSDRIAELHKEHVISRPRPAYIHQVPLEYIPGIGPKTLKKLKDHFKTEMDILHNVNSEALETVIPQKLSQLILQARTGSLRLKKGGGGIYGKVEPH